MLIDHSEGNVIQVIKSSILRSSLVLQQFARLYIDNEEHYSEEEKILLLQYCLVAMKKKSISLFAPHPPVHLPVLSPSFSPHALLLSEGEQA